MKNIKNIKKGIAKYLPKIVLSSFVIVFASCDFSYDLAEANSKVDTKAPTAFFGAVVGDGADWFKASFANASVSASSYLWDFGDGSEPSTEFEPKDHAYPVLPGSNAYEVTLQVFDSNGLTDTYTNSITITDNGETVIDYNFIYELINAGDAGEPVTVFEASSYQIEKDAFASNTLDKNEGTRWTAQDDAELLADDYKSDGEYVIYDLGAINDIRVIQFTTDVKPEAYGYQIWVSNTGTDEADFTKIIPETEDMQLSELATAEFQDHAFKDLVNARYVKLVGFGRFKEEEGVRTRSSQWMNFTQIEFFKDKQ